MLLLLHLAAPNVNVTPTTTVGQSRYPQLLGYHKLCDVWEVKNAAL
jgi:hypothetical protein